MRKPTARDGAVSELVEVTFPVGDRVRRDEAAGLLHAKFHDLAGHCWDADRQDAVIQLFGDTAALCAMTVPDFMDCVTEKPVLGARKTHPAVRYRQPRKRLEKPGKDKGGIRL